MGIVGLIKEVVIFFGFFGVDFGMLVKVKDRE